MTALSPTFAEAFQAVIGAEGGLSMDRNDPGNWTSGQVGSGLLKGTKYGVSAAAYPSLDIANLTLDAAELIYNTAYWRPVAGDALPRGIAILTFDTAVNMGVHTAVVLLQTALGVTADGALGPKTVQAVEQHGSNIIGLVIEFSAQRALRYAQIGTFSRYGLGWLRRVFKMTALALGPPPGATP